MASKRCPRSGFKKTRKDLSAGPRYGFRWKRQRATSEVEWPSRVLQIDMSFSTLYLRVRALLHDVVVTSCLKLNINNNFLSFHSPISPQPNC